MQEDRAALLVARVFDAPEFVSLAKYHIGQKNLEAIYELMAKEIRALVQNRQEDVIETVIQSLVRAFEDLDDQLGGKDTPPGFNVRDPRAVFNWLRKRSSEITV